MKIKTFTIVLTMLVSLSALAHPPGLFDDLNLKCGENQIDEPDKVIEKICFTYIYTGEHGQEDELKAPVIIINRGLPNSKVYPLIQANEQKYLVLTGEDEGMTAGNFSLTLTTDETGNMTIQSTHYQYRIFAELK